MCIIIVFNWTLVGMKKWKMNTVMALVDTKTISGTYSITFASEPCVLSVSHTPFSIHSLNSGSRPTIRSPLRRASARSRWLSCTFLTRGIRVLSNFPRMSSIALAPDDDSSRMDEHSSSDPSNRQRTIASSNAMLPPWPSVALIACAASPIRVTLFCRFQVIDS